MHLTPARQPSQRSLEHGSTSSTSFIPRTNNRKSQLIKDYFHNHVSFFDVLPSILLETKNLNITIISFLRKLGKNKSASLMFFIPSFFSKNKNITLISLQLSHFQLFSFKVRQEQFTSGQASSSGRAEEEAPLDM